jgi:hypothetical protein
MSDLQDTVIDALDDLLNLTELPYAEHVLIHDLRETLLDLWSWK